MKMKSSRERNMCTVLGNTDGSTFLVKEGHIPTSPNLEQALQEYRRGVSVLLSDRWAVKRAYKKGKV